MKKKLAFILVLIASLTVAGCLAVDQNIGGVFRTPASTATYTPTRPAIPTLPAANITCNELSFYLDPELGSGGECKTVPESTSPDRPSYYVFIYPTHTELSIQNYPLTRTQFPPQVWIYPVSRFEELLPDILPPRLSGLKKLISGSAWGSGELPFLPATPQQQSFFSHETGMSFNGGRGVRFITEYSEGLSPITSSNIIYTFQGLTDDGMYWVAVTLPISSPILPANCCETLPEGYTEQDLIQNYDTYVRAVKEALEAQAPGSFFPTIQVLDNLVESITVKP